MFMDAGVVDKLYLTVEPIIFGDGIHLFNKALDKKLELQEIIKLNSQTILLDYNVVK
jgi:dihydrofolate reductase